MGRVHASLLLVSLSPQLAMAQVFAGDHTGLAHTVVDTLLDPIHFFGINVAADTLDLNGDGVDDIALMSVLDVWTTYTEYHNRFMLLHGDVEAVVFVAGEGLAARLDEGDPVDEGWAWGNLANWPYRTTLAYTHHQTLGFGDDYAVGEEQWHHLGVAETEGYLGVRISQAGGMIYGWVHLNSVVNYEDVWMRIHDFAMETEPTAMRDQPVVANITAYVDANGDLRVQSALNEPLQLRLSDIGGRVVQQYTGPAPCTLGRTGMTSGIYLLTAQQAAQVQTFKIAWPVAP